MVGIGGIGMCGIAEMLKNLNFEITGSDLEISENTERLEKLGIKIFKGHSKKHILDPDVLIYSSAVAENNPEILEARRRNIPVIKRADMLGELVRMKWGIAITGTHGKTTTTSMVGHILQEAGFDPTIIVGGKLRTVNSTVKPGLSEFLVAEVDEYDRSLLKVFPTSAIITNIELEHLDCYKDIEDIKQVYINFCRRTPFYGILSVCIDNANIKSILSKIDKPFTTFGFSRDSDYRADNFEYEGLVSHFDLYEGTNFLGKIKLNVPGKHNILNALGSISLARRMGIEFEKIRKGLENFHGVYRRFEITDTINDIIFIDDYAHHPTEISSSLEAAKQGFKRKIIVIFQPHLYSRTIDFAEDFGKSFTNADYLFVTKIYPAREKPVKGITGKLISDSAKEHGHLNAEYIPENKDAVRRALELVKPGDILMTIGAGDVFKLNEEIRNILRQQKI